MEHLKRHPNSHQEMSQDFTVRLRPDLMLIIRADDGKAAPPVRFHAAEKWGRALAKPMSIAEMR